jgi:hypothetical protein
MLSLFNMHNMKYECDAKTAMRTGGMRAVRNKVICRHHENDIESKDRNAVPVQYAQYEI